MFKRTIICNDNERNHFYKKRKFTSKRTQYSTESISEHEHSLTSNSLSLVDSYQGLNETDLSTEKTFSIDDNSYTAISNDDKEHEIDKLLDSKKSDVSSVENETKTNFDSCSDDYPSELLSELSQSTDNSSLNSHGSNILNRQSSDDDQEYVDSNYNMNDQLSEESNSLSDQQSIDNTTNADNNLMDMPLYPGAPITLRESLTSTLLLNIRHNFSNIQLNDLLSWLNNHLIAPNNCANTIYKFKKNLNHLKIPFLQHYYCSNCYEKLKNEKSKCNMCKTKSGSCYFIQFSILSQLRTMFNREGFYDLLNYRFEKQKLIDANYEDIYDGTIYQQFVVNNGLLTNRSNISLMWYSDGLNVYTNSTYSIWPFYLRINELSFPERIKKENTILAGLWGGFTKPQTNMFMESFFPELKLLYEGIDFKFCGYDNLKKVRGILLCGTCDLPAKALVLNMSGHTSTYGCQICKIQSIKIQGRQVYNSIDVLEMRTTEDTIKVGEEVGRSLRHFEGIKGPTVLSKICHDFINSTSIDVMHCLDLGVIKKLLTIWFDPKHRTHEASLYGLIHLLDKKILKICPPSTIPRLPQAFSKLKYWKATEFRIFMLYYCLPLLHDVMKVQYFEHVELLIVGLSNLLTSSISPNMIEIASRSITEFFNRFEILYGAHYITSNVHQLLHLPDVVRKLGPLWTTSCYSFEHLNGVLKNLIHGTRYAQLQICSAVSLYFNSDNEQLSTINHDSNITSFCHKLKIASRNRRKLTQIDNKAYIIGKFRITSVINSQIYDALLSNNLLRNVKKFIKFERLFLNNIAYDSEEYLEYKKLKRKKINNCSKPYPRRNSSYVQYSDEREVNRFGMIKSFVGLKNCNCTKFCTCHTHPLFYVLIQRYFTVNNYNTPLEGIDVENIFLCRKLKSHDLISITNLKCVCYSVLNNCGSSVHLTLPISSIDLQ